MHLIYHMKEGYPPSKETIKSTNDSRIAMQSMIVETARIVNPKMVWFIWILTRFYTRKITNKSIDYNFFLFRT